MSFIFQRKTPAQLVKENQRLIQKSIRELERERNSLETQEKRVIADIKKQAKAGQMGSVRILAKDLVRTRHYVQKFYNMRAQLQAVSLRLQTMKSNQSIAEAMMGITKVMRSMNKRINLPSIQKIMQEFEKQNMAMEMKEEMMNDAMDESMAEEGEEEETDEIVNKILDEIGINVNESFSSTPTTQLKGKANERQSNEIDADLEARHLNLVHLHWIF